MSVAPDSGTLPSCTWQPVAGNAVLRERARLLRSIREFMHELGVLEVETPVLINTPVSDVHIDSFSVDNAGAGHMYLQTSPEYAMKRLLSAGSGPIYQICRVFRKAESGRVHNPEFTMLEWYRPGYDQNALMDELDLLIQRLGLPAAAKQSYSGLFREIVGLDPHTADKQDLYARATAKGLSGAGDSRPELLDYIFSHEILPGSGRDRPLFVYDFPACQSALARLSETSPVVARRFELFINGMEIANGFHELTDVNEQRQRFQADNRERQQIGKETVTPDEQLLAALNAGLPDCSGVAVGIDRLLMTILNIQRIDEVLAFPVERA